MIKAHPKTELSKFINAYKSTSSRLIKKEFPNIKQYILEDLKMKNMSQSLNLGKSVSDNGWGMFTSMLQYKAMFLGKQVIKIDKWFPSSKTCSCCGNVKTELSLSTRIYSCDSCNLEVDKDLIVYGYHIKKWN